MGKLRRRMNIKTNKRRLKAFATQALPGSRRCPRWYARRYAPRCWRYARCRCTPRCRIRTHCRRGRLIYVLFWITNPHQPEPEVSRFFFKKPEMLVDLFTFDHQYLLVVNKL